MVVVAPLTPTAGMRDCKTEGWMGKQRQTAADGDKREGLDGRFALD